MKLIQPTKIQAAGVNSLSIPCNLKNACDLLSLTMSYNWLRVGYFTWFGNRNALKCLCFLTWRGLSPAQAVPVQVVPGLSRNAVYLQLEGPRLSADIVRLEVEEPEGLRLSVSAICLEVKGLEKPSLSLGALHLQLGGSILAGL